MGSVGITVNNKVNLDQMCDKIKASYFLSSADEGSFLGISTHT